MPQNFSEALRWGRKAEAAGDPKAPRLIQMVLCDQQKQQAAAAGDSETIPSPPSPAAITIGTRVELRGLQAKPELNGRRGVVVKFVGSSGRYRVELDDGGEQFSLKAESLLAC